MTNAQLIPGLLAITAIALGVCVVVVRSVLREMHGGLGDKDESQAARRMTEKEALKVLKKWREGK